MQGSEEQPLCDTTIGVLGHQQTPTLPIVRSLRRGHADFA